MKKLRHMCAGVIALVLIAHIAMPLATAINEVSFAEAVDLGSDDMSLLLSPAIMADPDDYITESKYIIFNGDPKTYLVGNISPMNFALWLSRLDTVYELYFDLMGAEPPSGDKLIIETQPDPAHHYGWAWAYIGSNLIGWASPYVAPEMIEIEKTQTVGFGIPHEIGHLFDGHVLASQDNWLFNFEISANIKILYAMERNSDIRVWRDNKAQGGSYFRDLWYNDAVEKYNEGKLYEAILDNHDHLFFYFSPIVENAGWGIFESAFQSYINDSYTHQHTYQGSDDAIKFAGFIDRLTFFNNGVDVLSYSLDNGDTLRSVLPFTKNAGDCCEVSITALPGVGGAVSGGGGYAAGALVTLAATANSGYVFDGWYESNTKVSNDATYTFFAEMHRTLEARFSQVSTQPSIPSGYVLDTGIQLVYVDFTELSSQFAASRVPALSGIPTPLLDLYSKTVGENANGLLAYVFGDDFVSFNAISSTYALTYVTLMQAGDPEASTKAATAAYAVKTPAFSGISAGTPIFEAGKDGRISTVAKYVTTVDGTAALS